MSEQLLLATVMTTVIGAVAGYLGTLMLSKRMSLVGGPLGHLTLPGITLALIYGFDVSIGAFGMLILAILLIWLIEKRTKLPLETLTAIVFSASVAIAFLFLPHEEIEIALIGNINQISYGVVIASVALSLLVAVAVAKLYKRMVLVAISEDMARSEGINVERDSLIYLLAVATVIGLGVRVVGSLLTAALVSIPAATSRNLSRNMSQYAYGGAVAGGLAGAGGMIVHYYYSNMPAGPAMIVVSAVLFGISMLVRRK